MRWLAIDTSGGTGVGVVEVDGGGAVRVLAQRVTQDARGHVESLAPGVAEVLAQARMTAGDVEAVVVGTGPAPFTGLRVGLASAAGFARAREVPLHGVCSLEAIAWGAAGTGGGGTVLVATDARRREVYWAAYDTTAPATDAARVLQEPTVGPAADAVAWTGARGTGVLVLGAGAELYPEIAAAGDVRPGAAVDLGALVAIATTRTAAGLQNPVTPLYLRRPDVHVGTPRKRAT